MKLDDNSQGVRNSQTRWEEKDSKKTQGKRRGNSSSLRGKGGGGVGGGGVDRSNVTYSWYKFSRLAPNALGSILVNPSPDKSLQVSYTSTI